MKKTLLVITVIFFSAMLILTVFAEDIHNSSLPRVTASQPEQRYFPYEYTDENGNAQTGSVQKTAVPKALSEQGVYVIYSAEKNGTVRSFVRLADVVTGEEKDGYVEIISGITLMDRIVTESSAELYDGAEVAMK
ncbi:MAG: hypothetical protein NC203_05680 [Firmicutes bacterium]|nr:hypothetical protein [[Eubacterium] siraeum]MCM1487842.1 hypothetical protein [Bacillota bacterium]